MTAGDDQTIAEMTGKARTAYRRMAAASDAEKANGLTHAAHALRAHAPQIAAANDRDMAAGEQAGLSSAMLDRLRLDADRIEGMASAIEQVAALADPVGEIIDSRARPNGLVMERVRVPVGVLGIIYESRPNVTADAAALGLRSGNAVILRGGSEAVHSNRAIHAAIVEGMNAAGLPADAVQLVHTQDRAAVGAANHGHRRCDLCFQRGERGAAMRVLRLSGEPAPLRAPAAAARAARGTRRRSLGGISVYTP